MTADPRPAERPATLGLVSWRLPGTVERALELAATSGVDGLQVDLGGPGRGEWLDAPGTLGKVGRTSASTAVRILAVSGNTLNDIGLTAAEGTRQAHRVRETVLRVLDAAHALGAPLAFVPSFRRSAVDGERSLRRTVEVLSWASGEAEDRGLVLANENAVPPAWAIELVEGVGSPAFRLLLDTYNLRGPDLVEYVDAVLPHLADQVHLKDGADGVAGRVPLGTGDGGVAEALSALVRGRATLRALVLENDYRDGDESRLAGDIAWVRERAAEAHILLNEVHR